MFRVRIVEKSTHTFYVKQLFPDSNAVYYIMWKNVIQLDRQQMTVSYGPMLFACTVNKAANTLSE